MVLFVNGVLVVEALEMAVGAMLASLVASVKGLHLLVSDGVSLLDKCHVGSELRWWRLFLVKPCTALCVLYENRNETIDEDEVELDELLIALQKSSCFIFKWSFDAPRQNILAWWTLRLRMGLLPLTTAQFP